MGPYGEALAAAYLRTQGYRLLFQNWRSGPHEIDLIAWHQGELAFIEVRTVSAHAPSPPETSIGPSKQAALHRAIQHFLQENPAYSALPARIDIVAIRLTHPPEVVLLPDAFR
ncbi:MAG: YraN family protein [Bacteroidetes bacterium]|nr:MAG: YraN family protein [Bacteroidota bacterium]